MAAHDFNAIALQRDVDALRSLELLISLNVIWVTIESMAAGIVPWLDICSDLLLLLSKTEAPDLFGSQRIIIDDFNATTLHVTTIFIFKFFIIGDAVRVQRTVQNRGAEYLLYLEFCLAFLNLIHLVRI